MRVAMTDGGVDLDVGGSEEGGLPSQNNSTTSANRNAKSSNLGPATSFIIEEVTRSSLVSWRQTTEARELAMAQDSSTGLIRGEETCYSGDVGVVAVSRCAPQKLSIALIASSEKGVASASLKLFTGVLGSFQAWRSPSLPSRTSWAFFSGELAQQNKQGQASPLSLSVEKFPDNPMIGRREIVDGKAGKYTWLTYKEVYETVLKVGASIRSCGVEKGGRCGIYGANCPEWVISMEACNAHGIYCVPLYDTLGAGAVEFILCHAEVQIAFVEEKKIGEVIKTFASATNFLKTIVSFGKVPPEQKEEVEKNGLSIYSWDEFLLLGSTQQFDLPPKEKDDICTIMYTSGTTGDPKGVIISNKSIITIISAVDEFLRNVNEQLKEDDVYISYLPLAHIFDRMIEEVFIYHGASIGFWRGDVKLLVEDIGELKPTVFCAVPRVLERIYGGLQDKVSSGGFLKKTLFNVAYKYKQGNMMKGRKHEEAAAIFDKIVFNKVKRGLGGRVRLILSGAAPLSNHVEEFLRVVTCSHVLQGYGLTETCAGSFVSLPNKMSMLGTVGPPVPYVEVRLESVPEMGYDALSEESPHGEICIRGDTLFSGYHKREDLTKEVMIDGWFHTGDIGEWQPDGSMKIIDRKKNIFKLSQGEYVAVENLENIYSLVPEVDSIWVYGNSFESSLVAVINPNKQALEHWAELNGVTGDFASVCDDPKAKEYILGELTKTRKEKKLKGFELIKAVHLDPVPFDMERDLLTPTYKKKRPQLLKYYQSIIDGLYKSTK